MIPCEERNDITPVCPHCQAALSVVQCRSIGSFLGKRFIYFCPRCLKVLGVSHRKGFWMG